MSAADVALFVVAENPSLVDPCVRCDPFILPLSDPNDIESAREIIATGANPGIIFAKIVAGSDGVNRDVLAPGEPLWSWHVIEFLGFATIVVPEFPEYWPRFVESDVDGFIEMHPDPDEAGVGVIAFRKYTIVAEVPEPGSVASAVAARLALLALGE